MKKIISLILALMLALTLFACGGEKEPVESPDPSPDETSSATDEESPDASPDATSEATEEGDLAEILAKGELVIGITEYAPMNYYDESGALVGFDTEFAEAVCAKLGITPKFVVINWDTKEIELKAKKIDCIWNGLTVKEDRKENMAFSASYLRNEQAVVIKASNADTYTDLASLAGKTVVAESGSAGEDAVKADLPAAEYTAVEAQSSALLEVKAGTADAAVIDITMAMAMTGEGTDYADLMIVSGIDMMDEEYAIGFRLESDMVARVNEVIGELLADGTLAATAEKYGLSDLFISK